MMERSDSIAIPAPDAWILFPHVSVPSSIHTYTSLTRFFFIDRHLLELTLGVSK